MGKLSENCFMLVMTPSRNHLFRCLVRFGGFPGRNQQAFIGLFIEQGAAVGETSVNAGPTEPRKELTASAIASGVR